MYVFVVLDVEDLVHPESDDVTLDVAKLLSAEGITATLCVVGEKARLWERRGRQDVLAAVGRHDVGLHSDRHSIHPTPSEYLADKGWEDGVAEAERREGPGVADLTRLFGRPPSTWATPGSGWAPQIPAATRKLGIPSHVYSHARAGQTGACWFAGQLCFWDWRGIPGGEDAYADDAVFEAALPQLLHGIEEGRSAGRQCLGLFAGHPTRLRHLQFWDALNYKGGTNADPAQYRTATRRTDEGYATALRNLRRTVLAVRDLPGVELITLRDVAPRFAPSEAPLPRAELRRLAQAVAESKEISCQEPAASPAQLLDAVVRAVVAIAGIGSVPLQMALRPVLGPLEPVPALAAPVSLYAETGVGGLQAFSRQIAATGHLPTSVGMGGVAVGPGPLLRLIAEAFAELQSGREPRSVTLTPGAEEPAGIAEMVEQEVIRSVPFWSPHRPDLPTDRLALHTRLQSWSLKPAALKA